MQLESPDSPLAIPSASSGAATLRPLQDLLLRRLVRCAFHSVPFYRDHWGSRGILPSMIRGIEDLPRLPIVTREQLREAGLEARLRQDLSHERLSHMRTSGSTGTPFDILEPRAHGLSRRLFFLRALRSGGYRPGDRLLLLTTGGARPGRKALRWHHVPSEAPVEEQAEALARIRPRCIYGLTAALRRLAHHLEEKQAGGVRPEILFTTAETLDPPTRHLLERVFGAVVRDIYGLTETGPVAWQCTAGEGHHLGNPSLLVEWVPGDRPGLFRLLVTPLLQTAMPLIRYDTGDLVHPAEGPCGCGRGSPRLSRIEGRAVDCILAADGRWHTPYALTLAIEELEGIARYRILQESRGAVRVEIQRPNGDRERLAAELVRRLTAVLGPETDVEVRFVRRLDAGSSRKFKVVENRLMPGDRPCAF